MLSGVDVRRAALDAVLRSRTFLNNRRLSALLEYLCERCFLDQANSIKEFNIAVDVFGRPADFDQSQDAIVRVEMHRLRKKLAEFYVTEGQREPIEIVIPSGHYVPEFAARGERASAPAKQLERPGGNGTVWPDKTQPFEWRASRKLLWVIAGFLLVAFGAILTMRAIHQRHRAMETPLNEPRANAELPTPGALMDGSVRILCGSTRSNWRDRAGNLWDADNFFSGGTAVDLPDHSIYRTRDAFLFHAMRTGEFSYKIPLNPGVYEMRLYFADQSYSPSVTLDGGESTRVFNITSNGEPLLRDFDIIADAGPNTADVRVFKDVHPAKDGYLHLGFSQFAGAPSINGIEIVPGLEGRLRPIRIVTQDNPITDRAGVVWSADNYFLNGRGIARSAAVIGTEDPQIYDRERYGNFSYAIPVADGRYRVTLRFAETYWGANNPGAGGVGSRLFDVYCNGVALLRDFDLLKEASPRTQIVKTFYDLRPNAQGKLLLSFVPIKNYATISAIEVLDESDR